MSSHKLGQWSATAIAGNDIFSSVLFVSGITIIFAGIYAPFVFIIAAIILYLFKLIYTEVVEALPINGGAYTCLLNGTSKTIAAFAGVTTLLMYVATAVISSTIAVEYANTIFHIPTIPFSVILLAVFALIVISGMKDSSKIALSIFSFHMLSLALFIILGINTMLNGHSYFVSNILYTKTFIPLHNGMFHSLYLAFSTSLLCLAGFQSSSYFIEEQKQHVFRKTLKNLVIGTAIFNPVISFIILNTLDYPSIARAKDFLLSDAAYTIGGQLFQYMIVADAFLILAGSIMTAYIGVSGLLFRMSSDGAMPEMLSIKNKKGGFPYTVLLFFMICTSIILITKGDVVTLIGVYTLAFLFDMALFAFGNLMLKETRKELKRTYSTPVFLVIAAFIAMILGILGHISMDSGTLLFFGYYLIPIFFIVFAIIYQDNFLTVLMKVFSSVPFIANPLKTHFEEVTNGRFVAFIHNNEKLFKILNYINRNETGRKITLVHCHCETHRGAGTGAKQLERLIKNLQEAGAFTHFEVEVISLETEFGPRAIDEIVKSLKVKRNRILIGSIHDFHPYDYASLGGVRVIF